MPLGVAIYTGWVREKDYDEWSCCGGPDWRLELVDEKGNVVIRLGTCAEGTIFEPFLGKKISIRLRDLELV